LKAWLGSVGYKSGLTFNDSKVAAEKALRTDLSANIQDTNEHEDFSIKHVPFLDGMESDKPTAIRAELMLHDTLTETVKELEISAGHK
jgi:hypothetical protein